MATDARFRLSPLPEVAAFLVERAQGHEPLQDAIVDEEVDAEVVLEALRMLLDTWLEEGRELHYQVDQFTEPYTWLAISDHLEAVQTFRDLL
ncbi:MAG: hypothetical protein ACRYFX_08665 [Janthinobacterium lividum]